MKSKEQKTRDKAFQRSLHKGMAVFMMGLMMGVLFLLLAVSLEQHDAVDVLGVVMGCWIGLSFFCFMMSVCREMYHDDGT